MKFSIIIPCLNGAETIATQLEALLRQRLDSPWEVIVADNGSTDATHEIVQRYASRLPGLRIVDASGRRGCGAPRNAGVKAAQGDAVLFCDADDEVSEGWLSAMAGAIERFDFVTGPAECKKLNRYTLADRSESKLRYHPHFPGFLPFASGFNIGIKRRIHETVGGFDESMPSAEDIDYSWRVQLAGTPLHYVPEAVIHYRYRSTLAGIYRQARAWGEHDAVLYKRYRQRGMPKLPPWAGIRHWGHLLLHLPKLRGDRRRLDLWLRHVGYRMGRLRGSAKHRTWVL